MLLALLNWWESQQSGNVDLAAQINGGSNVSFSMRSSFELTGGLPQRGHRQAKRLAVRIDLGASIAPAPAKIKVSASTRLSMRVALPCMASSVQARPSVHQSLGMRVRTAGASVARLSVQQPLNCIVKPAPSVMKARVDVIDEEITLALLMALDESFT